MKVAATQCAARILVERSVHATRDRTSECSQRPFGQKRHFRCQRSPAWRIQPLKAERQRMTSVAFGYPKVRVKRPPGRGTYCPVFVKSGSGCGQLASRSAANGLMGRISTTVARQNQDLRKPSVIPFLSVITRHGKLQLPCPGAHVGATQQVI